MEDGTHRANVINNIFTEQWRDPTARYDAMLKIEGSEMAWDVENVNRSAPIQSISRDAMELLSEHFRTWLGSRIMRRMNEGKSARKVKVVVSVVVE